MLESVLWFLAGMGVTWTLLTLYAMWGVGRDRERWRRIAEERRKVGLAWGVNDDFSNRACCNAECRMYGAVVGTVDPEARCSSCGRFMIFAPTHWPAVQAGIEDIKRMLEEGKR